MKLKKIFAAFLAAAMLSALAVGCSQKDSTQDPAGGGADADQWPARGISLIVPFKAGGDTDYYARLYAQYLEKELGVTVTVVNTEGAGGSVGAESVASADPDGYTCMPIR